MAGETDSGGALIIRTYFNHQAAVWDDATAEKDITKLRMMAERLNIAPGSILLDVGTGTGVFIPFLLSKVGQNGQIVAVDFAQEMLKKAQMKNLNGNVDYLCADVLSLPLGNEIFDTVVCYSSFPHFQDKRRALAEINRVTKNDGRLFICHTSSRAAINKMHVNIPAVSHDTIPNQGEIAKLLSEAGFVNIEVADKSESYLCRAQKARIRVI